MVYRWLRRPISLAIPLVVLALLFTVACGTAEQPATSGSETTMPAMPAPQEPAKAVATAMPQAMSEPQAKAKLDRITIAVAPLGWDTNYSYKVTTSGLLDKRMVLEWLIGVDRETGVYIPELAESWEMASNGKDWTFKLRQGVQWQGGPHNPDGWGEFTAEDVKHSLWLLVHPDSSASGIGTWRKLTGVNKGDDYPAVATKIDDLVKVTDDNTVSISFQTAMPEALFNLSRRRNMPMESKARWDAIGHEGYGEAIVGTGPLKFIERIEGVHVTYEALPDHWRKVPEYSSMEFRWVQEPSTRLAALLTEEVHLSDIERAARPEAIAKGMKVIASTQPALMHKWFFGGLWSTELEKLDPANPLLEPKVRWALNLAINREAIAEAMLQGSKVRIPSTYGYDPVLDESVWPGVFNQDWYDSWDKYYGYNPERAKELLAEAGYANGFEFTIYLFTQPGLPEMVDIGQAMALDFEAIGLEPKLVNLEYSAVRKLYRSQSPDIVAAIWPSRSTHPANYSVSMWETKATVHGFQDARIDAFSDELDRTVENRERSRILREIGDIIYYEHAMIQMFGLDAEIVVNPKYIANYVFPGLMSGYYTHLEHIETVPQ
jgi:ABC-type transport system substrate-binding protein